MITEITNTSSCFATRRGLRRHERIIARRVQLKNPSFRIWRLGCGIAILLAGDLMVACMSPFPVAEKRVSVEGTTPSRMSNFEVKDVSSRHSAVAASWDEDPHATTMKSSGASRAKSSSLNTPPTYQPARTASRLHCPQDKCGLCAPEPATSTCAPGSLRSAECDHSLTSSPVRRDTKTECARKSTSLYGNASWEKVPGATYYKVWYADTATSGMVPHITRASSHEFYVPSHGTWDFLVQACTMTDASPPAISGWRFIRPKSKRQQRGRPAYRGAHPPAESGRRIFSRALCRASAKRPGTPCGTRGKPTLSSP